MPLFYPDIFRPNNPNVAQLDSEHLRGGRRVVDNLSELYALSTKSDQLKEYVTIVTVLNDGVGEREYILTDINDITTANGWKLYKEQVTLKSTDDFDTSASDSSVPTSLAVKNAILAQLGTIGNLQSNFDAAANPTLFPISVTPPTRKGDYWIVNTPGTVNGVVLNIGDLVIAKIQAPNRSSSTDWIFIESNRGYATNTTEGVVRLADNSDAIAATDSTLVMTPIRVKEFFESKKATDLDVSTGTNNEDFVTPFSLKGNTYTTSFGNGVDNTFVITHNLNTITPIVQLIKTNTSQIIYAEVKIDNINQVMVSLGIIPSANEFTVIVKK